MVLLLPSRIVPISTQLQLSGLGLLAWALAGLVSGALQAARSSHPAVQLPDDLFVAALYVCSVLLALLLSRTYWSRVQELLAEARPASADRLPTRARLWDLAQVAVFLVIGVGMVAVFAQRSPLDLAIATVALAYTGTGSLGTALRIRRVECCNHVLYYCLADSLRSWRLVSMDTR